MSLERVQQRATKFILNDYSSNYRYCLVKLGMLPLMYVYELANIMFYQVTTISFVNKFDIDK